MPELALQVMGMAAGAVAVYAAIRADLAGLRVLATMAAKRADDAHARIDIFFNQRGKLND